jgi:hypothetical protein
MVTCQPAAVARAAVSLPFSDETTLVHPERAIYGGLTCT